MKRMTKKQSVAEKKAFVAQVQECHCPQAGRTFDVAEYPPIVGMSAPERVSEYADRVLYWDGSEGAYYDRKTDLYDYCF
jgi:hypothetical protein